MEIKKMFIDGEWVTGSEKKRQPEEICCLRSQI